MNVKISDGRKWFYQWDVNQRLTLEDIPEGTPIHFSSLDDTLALVVLAASDDSGVYVNVPNILLQKSGELHVYVYITNGDEGHTEQYWEYEIIEREQPSDYVYIETETKPLGSDCHITYLESLDADNPVILRDLDSGTYVLHGKFKPYSGYSSNFTFSDGMIVTVVKQTSKSYVQVFYSKNNAIQYLEISDTDFFRKDAKLIDIESISNKTTTVDENSTDTQYPSAKAVYSAIASVGSGLPEVAGTNQQLVIDENGIVKWEDKPSMPSGCGDSAGDVLWEDYSCSLASDEIIPVDLSEYRYVEVLFRLKASTFADAIFRTGGMIVGNDNGALCEGVVLWNTKVYAVVAFVRYSSSDGGFVYNTNYNRLITYDFTKSPAAVTTTSNQPCYPVRIVGYK